MHSDYNSIPDFKPPEDINVNLTVRNLNKELGFGLNKNRRGAIQDHQLEALQSAQVNHEENFNFGR